MTSTYGDRMEFTESERAVLVWALQIFRTELAVLADNPEMGEPELLLGMDVGDIARQLIERLTAE